MSETFKNCIVDQIRVASASSLQVEHGKPGLICVGVPASGGLQPLLLVWDEDTNDGASATNAFPAILNFLANHWEGRFPTRDAVVVQRDSMGSFDHVCVQWPPSGVVVDVSWRPLRCAVAEGDRTQAALRETFGQQAHRALETVEGVQRGVFSHQLGLGPRPLPRF